MKFLLRKKTINLGKSPIVTRILRNRELFLTLYNKRKFSLNRFHPNPQDYPYQELRFLNLFLQHNIIRKHTAVRTLRHTILPGITLSRQPLRPKPQKPRIIEVEKNILVKEPLIRERIVVREPGREQGDDRRYYDQTAREHTGLSERFVTLNRFKLLSEEILRTKLEQITQTRLQPVEIEKGIFTSLPTPIHQSIVIKPGDIQRFDDTGTKEKIKLEERFIALNRNLLLTKDILREKTALLREKERVTREIEKSIFVKEPRPYEKVMIKQPGKENTEFQTFTEIQRRDNIRLHERFVTLNRFKLLSEKILRTKLEQITQTRRQPIEIEKGIFTTLPASVHQSIVLKPQVKEASVTQRTPVQTLQPSSEMISEKTRLHDRFTTINKSFLLTKNILKEKIALLREKESITKEIGKSILVNEPRQYETVVIKQPGKEYTEFQTFTVTQSRDDVRLQDRFVTLNRFKLLSDEILRTKLEQITQTRPQPVEIEKDIFTTLPASVHQSIVIRPQEQGRGNIQRFNDTRIKEKIRLQERFIALNKNLLLTKDILEEKIALLREQESVTKEIEKSIFVREPRSHEKVIVKQPGKKYTEFQTLAEIQRRDDIRLQDRFVTLNRFKLLSDEILRTKLEQIVQTHPRFVEVAKGIFTTLPASVHQSIIIRPQLKETGVIQKASVQTLQPSLEMIKEKTHLQERFTTINKSFLLTKNILNEKVSLLKGKERVTKEIGKNILVNEKGELQILLDSKAIESVRLQDRFVTLNRFKLLSEEILRTKLEQIAQTQPRLVEIDKGIFTTLPASVHQSIVIRPGDMQRTHATSIHPSAAKENIRLQERFITLNKNLLLTKDILREKVALLKETQSVERKKRSVQTLFDTRTEENIRLQERFVTINRFKLLSDEILRTKRKQIEKENPASIPVSVHRSTVIRPQMQEPGGSKAGVVSKTGMAHVHPATAAGKNIRLRERFLTSGKDRLLTGSGATQPVSRGSESVTAKELELRWAREVSERYPSRMTFNAIPRIDRKNVSATAEKELLLPGQLQADEKNDIIPAPTESGERAVEEKKYIETQVDTILHRKITTIEQSLSETIHAHEMDIDWLATKIFNQLKDELDVEYRRL